MTSYLQRAVKGTGVLFVLGVVSYFFGYLTRIILARNLSVEQYGLFYAVLSFIVFSTIFADMGLGNALIKFIAQYEAKKKFSKIKTLILSAQLFKVLFTWVIITIFFAVSKYLSVYYFKEPLSFSVFRALLIYLIAANILFFGAKEILRGFQNITWFATADPFKNIFTFLLVVIFLKLGFEIFAAVYAYILGVVLTFLVLLPQLSKYLFILKSKVRNFWPTTRQLFSFSIPVTFTGFGDMVISYVDILLLTYFASLTAVGVYNVILPTAMMFLFFGRAISGVFFPMVSELWSKGDKQRVKKGVGLIYTYSFVFIVPVLLAVGLFGQEFITLFFGSDYASGTNAFRILLFGVLFFVVAQSNHHVISAIGKPAIVTKIILTVAAINFGLNLILIPVFKLTGAAIATAVSYFAALLISSRKLRQFVGLNLPWSIWARTILSGAVFVVIFYYVLSLGVSIWIKSFLAFVISSIIYVFLIFTLKVVSLKEVKLLLRQFVPKATVKSYSK